MTVFEAIMLMLTFGTLIVAILCPINANRPPPSQRMRSIYDQLSKRSPPPLKAAIAQRVVLPAQLSLHFTYNLPLLYHTQIFEVTYKPC
ncbi:hypothetical protein DC345_25875 [Paenibacillus taichungensis]|uniref:Uncharacterized protein n=1 Tax=Paenibacillus taichungensis TaxID=484184 RepID=A0A329QGQ8_9BACL|nr:hypothetical protein DC345_25875 [Paenibacillus taichungensis]